MCIALKNPLAWKFRWNFESNKLFVRSRRIFMVVKRGSLNIFFGHTRMLFDESFNTADNRRRLFYKSIIRIYNRKICFRDFLVIIQKANLIEIVEFSRRRLSNGRGRVKIKRGRRSQKRKRRRRCHGHKQEKN